MCWVGGHTASSRRPEEHRTHLKCQWVFHEALEKGSSPDDLPDRGNSGWSPSAASSDPRYLYEPDGEFLLLEP